MPNCSSKPSAVRPYGGIITPALLISRSIPSQADLIWPAATRTDSSEARSSGTTRTSAPGAAARIRVTASCALPWSRQPRINRAPRPASTRAASKPMPELPPVITAVRPD